MHWNTFKQDNYSTVGGEGGYRVGDVQAGTTSPMPDHKGTVTVRDPPTLFFLLNYQTLSTLRIKYHHTDGKYSLVLEVVVNTTINKSK